MSDDERAIRELMASWMTASSAGDVPKVLSLIADDAVFLVPSRPPFGKQEFATASRAMRDVRCPRRPHLTSRLTKRSARSPVPGPAVHGPRTRRYPRSVLPSLPPGRQAMPNEGAGAHVETCGAG